MAMTPQKFEELQLNIGKDTTIFRDENDGWSIHLNGVKIWEGNEAKFRKLVLAGQKLLDYVAGV